MSNQNTTTQPFRSDWKSPHPSNLLVHKMPDIATAPRTTAYALVEKATGLFWDALTGRCFNKPAPRMVSQDRDYVAKKCNHEWLEIREVQVSCEWFRPGRGQNPGSREATGKRQRKIFNKRIRDFEKQHYPNGC